MNILISGGSGLVGKSLVKKLTAKGHIVRVLSRNKTDLPNEFYWNLRSKFIDHKAFENLDCIIHLAGASISKRWTNEYKKELYSSRIETADLLKKYCIKNGVKLKSFISASGANFYGTFTSDEILDENSGAIKQDFLADLCIKWEKAALNFSDLAERVVCLRTAMVLAKNGGAFPILKKTVDFNFGSAVGSGNQWMNWIHLDDLVNMYIFALENAEISGVYNAVADDVPTNQIFMKTLSNVSGKLFFPLNVPSIVLKLLFGEMSSIILKGTRISNKKIKSQGFDFQYSELDKAFEDLVRS